MTCVFRKRNLKKNKKQSFDVKTLDGQAEMPAAVPQFIFDRLQLVTVGLFHFIYLFMYIFF